MSRLTISNMMTHPDLFGPHFVGPSWDRWRAVNMAAFGEGAALTPSQLASFREVAGNRDPPKHRVEEFIVIAGRGAGKDSNASFLAATIAVMFNPKTARLRPGEHVFVLCLAVDKAQAGICFGMTKAFFETIPTLKAMIKKIGPDSIVLTNRVIIKITTADFKAVRGRGILAAIFDEGAFWATDTTISGGTTAANPDVEVHAAISPGLARVKGSMLIMISSAYRRTGLLYSRWKEFYGKPDDDILVVKGGTRDFNSTFPQATIDRALLLDRPRYAAEYLSVWRDDLQSLVGREVVEDCINPGTYEIAPKQNISYIGFIDGASGSGQDSFALAVGHLQDESVVIDCLREVKPPFSPELVSKEFADVLLSYHISFCLADKYGGEWISEQFSKFGVRVDQGAKSKSEMYLDLLAMLSSRRVALLDHPRSVSQICSLERRSRMGGRAAIDAPKGQHEDVANCIAGIISSSFFKYNLDSMGDDADQNDDILRARRLREAKANSHWPETDHMGRPMVFYAHVNK